MDGHTSRVARASDGFPTIPVDRIMESAPSVPLPPPANASGTLPDEAHEPLAHIGREMAREMAADAILIAWHVPSEPPMRLFADGDWTNDALERQVMERMEDALPAGRTAQWRWIGDDGQQGELLGASIPASDGVVTIVALYRNPGAARDLRTERVMRRLIPLVQPFFRMWALRLRSNRIAASLAAAIDHSDVATALVDGHGELLFVNAAAGRMIERGEGLRRTGNHLAGERLSDTLRLQAAIEHALGEARSGASPPVVALKRYRRRALLAAVVAHESNLCGERGVEAVVYIFDPEQNLDNLAEPVCKHYGLSPVETKLACLLANGSSLAVAAEQMRVREQTARTYLKQIFSKTDTRRQAEFVLLMLKSSVRLLSHSRPSFF